MFTAINMWSEIKKSFSEISKSEFASILLCFFRYGIIGAKVRLETSTLCQLKCPECVQRDEKKMTKIKRGYLRYNNFKNFIDTHPYIRKIEISSYGEIFLNPELDDIIRYSYKKNIALTAYNGVNFNTVNTRTIENMVKYKFVGMTVSLEGATNDTYSKYRKNGDLSSVLKNINKLNYFKALYRSKKPKLYIKFIFFDNNKHEIASVREIAKKNNAFFLASPDARTIFSSIKKMGRDKISFSQKINFKLLCLQLWMTPQINWDGRLWGCCVNFKQDFGNVFRHGLKKCVNSKKYFQFKKEVLSKAPSFVSMCDDCKLYRKLPKIPLSVTAFEFLLLVGSLGLCFAKILFGDFANFIYNWDMITLTDTDLVK